MKQYLTLVLGVMIVSSPAFASRARLESLGENANGSYYIQDSRDIFLNPANINNYKKKLFLELGSATSTVDSHTQTAGSTTQTTVDSSKVQGGFTNTFGDFTYGLYFGKESDRMETLIATANALIPGGTMTNPDHAIDFFFGGEAGVKWGVDVIYQGSQNRAAFNNTTSGFGVRAGVNAGNLDVFATVGISGEAKEDTGVATTTNDLKSKTDLDVGVTYGMDDMTLFAKFTTFGAELFSGTAISTAVVNGLGLSGLAGSTDTTVQNMNWGIGAGWKKEASKTVTMFSRVEVDYQKMDYKSVTAGTTNASETWWNVPVVVGAEAQATSWLAVRGSISHVLVGQHIFGSAKDSMDNMNTASVGVGLTFGDIMIDGLVATDGTNTNTNSRLYSGAPGMGTGSQSNTTFGFGNNMLSRISLTYNF